MLLLLLHSPSHGMETHCWVCVCGVQFVSEQHYSQLQTIYTDHDAHVSSTTLYWVSEPVGSRTLDCVQPIMIVSR